MESCQVTRHKIVYLVQDNNEQNLTDVLRRIELARLTGKSIVPLTKAEFNIYKEAIEVEVEVPPEKPYVPEDHQEILKRFREHCSDFADYLREYDAKYTYRAAYIDNLIYISELARDLAKAVINHEPIDEILDFYNLTNVRRTTD